MRLIIAAVLAFTIAACASIGRPEGGPKDELPPVYVRSTPLPGTRNFNKNVIEIYFDENIKLDDASNKFVVSPAQQQMPQINANGKKLTVTLRDTLIENQTYTLDFSDAIRDLNEGNILDGFVLDFATGDSIDSLRISGLVLDAQTLEPAQGMLVGAYRNFADSAIRTLRVERVCKTNQLGEFTLRNLKNEFYRLFAINDVNRDYHWDRSEDVAFYDVPIKPWAENIVVTDTLRAFDGSDSIATRPGLRYLPNDILLAWFNENYTPLYMKDHSRNKRHIVRLEFSAPVDTLPHLLIVNGENEGKYLEDFSLLNKSLNNDTLEYWIADSSIIQQDSLLIATKYLKTDTNNLISWTTDTIRYFFRLSRAEEKDLEKKAEAKEKKEAKRLEAIKKWEETGDSSLIADTIPEIEPIDFIEIKPLTGSTQDYHRPVRFSFSEPIASWDKSKARLEWLEDSTWYPVVSFEIEQDTTGKIMEYILSSKWEFETQYKFTVDSATIITIYDKWNNAFKHDFKIKSPDDYSTLIFDIPSKPYNPPVKFDWDSLRRLYSDSIILAEHSLDSIFHSNSELSDSIGLLFIPEKVEQLNFTQDNIVADSVNSTMVTVVDSLSLISDSLELTANYPDSLKAPETTPGIIVELLSSNEQVVARVPVIDGKARFDFLSPGTYYARAFIDFNGNGVWDTGNIAEWQQPEDMYYYPSKINLKQNWDISQTWDLYEMPLDTQKPWDIKKNKPKTKERPVTDEEEEDDSFDGNYFYQPGNAYGNGGNTYNGGSNVNSGLRSTRTR